jgi:hypothetical protein
VTRVERCVAPARRLEIGRQPFGVGTGEPAGEKGGARSPALRLGAHPDPRQVPVGLVRMQAPLELHSGGERPEPVGRHARLEMGHDRLAVGLD